MNFQAQDITVFVFCSGPDADPERTLDGLVAQTVAPGRVVVIDNALDRAVAIDPFFAAHSSASVAVVRTPEAMSESGLRNFALNICSGPLFGVVDAGLIPAPDWVELMLLSLTPQCHCLKPVAGVVAGVGGRTAWIIPPSDGTVNSFDGGDRPLRDPEFIHCGNCLLRTDLLRRIGGFGAERSGVELGRDLKARLQAVEGTLIYMPDIRCGCFI